LPEVLLRKQEIIWRFVFPTSPI